MLSPGGNLEWGDRKNSADSVEVMICQPWSAWKIYQQIPLKLWKMFQLRALADVDDALANSANSASRVAANADPARNLADRPDDDSK
jgi:hypothetical protein